MTVARVFSLAAGAATLLLLAALYAHGADPRDYWSPTYATGTALGAGACALLAVLLRLAAPARAVPLLGGLAATYLALGLGLMPVAACTLAACACLLTGRRLLEWIFPAQPATATSALLCGLALYLALFGIMIHFPVNYRAVYVVLLAAPLGIAAARGRLPALLRQLRTSAAALHTTMQALSYPAFAAAVLGTVFVARHGFLPTLGFDDNALHLGMWSQLRHGQVYEFDFRAQVWEVAPFAVDLLHAAVNLVAGTDARGATNVLLLAMLLRQLWVILGALQIANGHRLFVLLLFLSTPLAGYSLVTLQTELFMALLATAGVRLVLELRAWCSPHSAALLALAALCCATKLPGAGLGVMLLAAAGLRLWSLRAEPGRPAPRSIALLALFTLALATLAFNAYVTAWIKTGNPVFPLYNAIFQSPYFPLVNFSDERWTRGFSLASYWDLFFHTSAYFESRDFVAGFQYLLLFPLGLAALLASPALRVHAASLLLPLFGYALFVFAATQYWRYQFPILPLASIVIGALLAPGHARHGRLLINGALAVCLALNLAFHPGISGLLGEAPEQAWTAAGKDRMIERYAPARMLNDWLNTNAPGSRVLYHEATPFGATLDGTPIYVNWYAPETSAAFLALRTEADGLAFLRDQEVDYAMAWSNAPGPPGSRDWTLRTFLSRHAEPIVQAGDQVLYRVGGDELTYTSIFNSQERSAIDATPRLLGRISTAGAAAFRYRAEFACVDDAGYFVAQINWDNGQYYYHEIPCSAVPLQFVEALPVPPGAGGGELWARTVGTAAATLTRLGIETR